MGKTPKKAAPGGDERNLYVRRLKATATASSKVCDMSSTVKQRESEILNREKNIGVQKRLAGPAGKVFKSKLRSPATTKSHRALKNPPRFQPTVAASKDEKKLVPATSKDQDTSSTVPTMQLDSEEAAVQLKVSITKKDTKEVATVEVATDVTTIKDNQTETSESSVNGKIAIELTETENATPRDENEKTEVSNDKNTDKPATEENVVDSHDKVDESSLTIISDNKTDDPCLESEDSPLKLEDEGSPSKSIAEQNGDSHESTTSVQKEQNQESNESSERKKVPENCSVDVVESTTSEALDSRNLTQAHKENNQSDKDNIENDASFVSYDSSIMLKDVQIKLNDCLKDNSKLFDVSNADDSVNANEQNRHDLSFGKTLRSISGRNTINRLRYVTVREQRFSPNSSLFVNTSRASSDPDDLTGCPLTRYPTDLSDMIINNGSLTDRKRKTVSDAIESAKKLKTETKEGGGLLNTSLEMLKSIRRPVQVSTPNAKGYNFHSDRFNAKGFGDDKTIINADAEPKKWCVVM